MLSEVVQLRLLHVLLSGATIHYGSATFTEIKRVLRVSRDDDSTDVVIRLTAVNECLTLVGLATTAR